MLFDLRGRGRRRTIQAIYLMLAVLMGGGLVFFGIGGNVGGGLLDAIQGKGGSSSATNANSKEEKAALRRTRLSPQNPAGWAALAQVRYQRALQDSDPRTGAFKPSGRRALTGAATAWDRYLALKPKKVDVGLATTMVEAFKPGALNDLVKATEAQELIVQAQPTASTFEALATLAYAAGQTRKGDLAAAEALRRTPPDFRPTVKERLAQAKNPQSAGGSTTSTTTTATTSTAPPATKTTTKPGG